MDRTTAPLVLTPLKVKRAEANAPALSFKELS